MAGPYTPDQQRALDEVVEAVRAKKELPKIGGLAGTGKTYLAAGIPKALRLYPDQVAYCAYTGKAAMVLRRNLGTDRASTIHRLMYAVVHKPGCPNTRNRELRCVCKPLQFQRRSMLDPALRLIIVDESSMITEKIYRDLSFFGVPILWIGDHGQLGPITPKGSEPFNLMDDPDIRLEEIHRQKAGSPILTLAMKAREGASVAKGNYGEGPRAIDLGSVGGTTVFLCHTNPTRIRVNDGVRSRKGLPADRPVIGDRVVCLNNNYDKGVVNGSTGTIVQIQDRRETYDIEVDLDGEGSYRGNALKAQFGQRKLDMRNVDLWDYAYCLTVHKAQGSEYDRVAIIDDYCVRKDRARWWYTAITRAKQQLSVFDEAVIEQWM